MIKSYENETAILPYRFVKFDGNSVTTASAKTDTIIGVSDSIGADENGVVEVYHVGEIAQVQAGEALNAGDPLTSDAEGLAVKATASDNIGAIAFESASAKDDVIKVLVVLQVASASEAV